LNVEYPVTILSDLHVGHPGSYITDPEALAPLFRGAATVVFNGDTVEMLWVCNRDHAQEQMEKIARACLDQGARPVFLNGNHDPVISSGSFIDLCDGAVLATHGDILFHEIAPWSPDSRVVGPEHSRLLNEMNDEARGDLTERLIVAKRASLRLEMHEPKRSGHGFAGLAMAVREGWPPWRALRIIRCWMQTPRLADELAQLYRPRARFVLIGHTHWAGVWQRSARVVVNTGSFLPFSGRSLVRITPARLEVHSIVRRGAEWHPGTLLWQEEIRTVEVPVPQQ
jgi:UDP-2,3-diacylglucosamine pyrophosphatase LpxH